MNYEEAKYQLRLHTEVLDTARERLILDDGFLPSLRPYRGLQEKNLHLVAEALLTVGERLHREPAVDRDLVATFYSMCYYARLWGVQPDGMLQHNELISTADAARLALWIDILEQTMLTILNGQPPYRAVRHYTSYIVDVGWHKNIDFFVPLLCQAVAQKEVCGEIETTLTALAKLEGLATVALPALHEANLRTFSFANPATPLSVEQDTERIRTKIRDTISAIEKSVSERPG